MPKVSKAGKFRKVAGEGPRSETAALNRGQRKRLAKREQYLKREKLILSSLQLKRQEDQKKRIYGLDALKAAISTVETTATSDSKPEEPTAATAKGKRNLAAREMQHMNLVLQHPAFQSNPFEAIQQHLRNSLAGQAREPELKSKERTRVDMAKQEERKKMKKERIQAAGGRHRKKFHAVRKSR